jgi:hypothetical protein
MFLIVLTVNRDYLLKQDNRLAIAIETQGKVRIQFNILLRLTSGMGSSFFCTVPTVSSVCFLAYTVSSES